MSTNELMKILTLTVAVGVALMASGMASDGEDRGKKADVDEAIASAFVEAPARSMILAQMGDGAPRGFGDRMGPRHDQRRKAIEQLRMLKMLEVLELQEDQEVEFLTLFNRMRSNMRELRDEKAQLMERLVERVESDATNGDLESLIDDIIRVERQRRQTELDFIEASREVLTPPQLAKLIVFHERFEREILERLQGFRGRMGHGDGDSPRPDGPPKGNGRRK